MQHHETRIPSKNEIKLAEQSLKKLLPLTQANEARVQFIHNGNKTETITLPLPAVELLLYVLSQMSKGHAVTLMPVLEELTTQQAADLLNVSRPYLVKLLETKKIPYRKVGNRRMVLAQDIIRYKENIDKQREEILDILAQEAQENNMGY